MSDADLSHGVERVLSKRSTVPAAIALTPEQKEILRRDLADIREIAEDFSKTYYNLLFALAPELRLYHLSQLSDDGGEFCHLLAATIDALDDPAEMVRIYTLLQDVNVANEEALRVHRRLHGAFIAAMERCFGKRFDETRRAAWLAMNELVEAAILAAGPSFSPESRKPQESVRAWPGKTMDCDA